MTTINISDQWGTQPPLDDSGLGLEKIAENLAKALVAMAYNPKIWSRIRLDGHLFSKLDKDPQGAAYLMVMKMAMNRTSWNEVVTTLQGLEYAEHESSAACDLSTCLISDACRSLRTLLDMADRKLTARGL